MWKNGSFPARFANGSLNWYGTKTFGLEKEILFYFLAGKFVYCNKVPGTMAFVYPHC